MKYRYRDFEESTTLDVVRVPEGISLQMGPTPDDGYISVVLTPDHVEHLAETLIKFIQTEP